MFNNQGQKQVLGVAAVWAQSHVLRSTTMRRLQYCSAGIVRHAVAEEQQEGKSLE